MTDRGRPSIAPAIRRDPPGGHHDNLHIPLLLADFTWPRNMGRATQCDNTRHQDAPQKTVQQRARDNIHWPQTNCHQHFCEEAIEPGCVRTCQIVHRQHQRTTILGIVAALLGGTPAGTALLAALLRAALGRPPGRLPLAALLGGRLPARRTSLGRHGSKD